MSDKKHIIDSIAVIARELGRAPSHAEFMVRSGISAHSILQRFDYWNDAVRAAGFRPNMRNVKIEDRALLEDWGRQVRRNRGIPTIYAYRRKGRYEPSTFGRRYGPWSKVPKAFRKFAKDKREWADVLALLRGRKQKRTCRSKQNSPNLPNENRSLRFAVKPRMIHQYNCKEQNGSGLGKKPQPKKDPPLQLHKVHHTPLRDRPTCGNPIDFDGLRHEPVNEQGVVLLFGMLAKGLGFLVEGVQQGFPDCEAKRRVGLDRWQRVNIEFEYESRNYRDHRHPLHGCDVIVCWRHNWDDCPKHIEVVELCSAVHCSRCGISKAQAAR